MTRVGACVRLLVATPRQVRRRLARGPPRRASRATSPANAGEEKGEESGRCYFGRGAPSGDSPMILSSLPRTARLSFLLRQAARYTLLQSFEILRILGVVGGASQIIFNRCPIDRFRSGIGPLRHLRPPTFDPFEEFRRRSA